MKKGKEEKDGGHPEVLGGCAQRPFHLPSIVLRAFTHMLRVPQHNSPELNTI